VIPPLGIRQLPRQLYGHSYIAWYVYLRIEMQLSYAKINSIIYEMVKDKIGASYGGMFIKFLSEYYQETEKGIIQKILLSPFIHADETSVSILGENHICLDFLLQTNMYFQAF
jgi:hypothetical protein